MGEDARVRKCSEMPRRNGPALAERRPPPEDSSRLLRQRAGMSLDDQELRLAARLQGLATNVRLSAARCSAQSRLLTFPKRK